MTVCLRGRRVPVVLQMSQVECGAACLAMVLSYFGRSTGLAECRELCVAGRDGATADAIVQAARAQGLRVKAFSLEPAAFEHAPLPAIVHWNFNHFIVVERWSRGHVDVIDPAIGRLRLTAEEFDAGFTGVVLALEPGVQFQRRAKKGRSVWQSYLAPVRDTPGVRGLLLQVLGASLFLQIVGLALPIVTGIIVDQILPYGMNDLMPVLGAGVAVIALVQLLTSYLRAALLIYLQRRLDARLMLNFFEHLLSLPFRYFAERASGDLLQRLGSNSVLRETLTGDAVGALLDGALAVTYLIVLGARDQLFGGLVFGLGLLQALLLLGTAGRAHRLMQRHLVAQAASQSYLFEALSGIATLKASGAEARALDRWSDLFAQELNVALQRSHLAALAESAMAALRVFSPLILLWLGAQRVLDGTMGLGTMLALTALSGTFLTAIASLVATGQRLQLVGAHLERLDDVLEAEPEQDLHLASPAPRLSGRIELRNVGFRFDASGPWVVRNVSLTIEPGQHVALVGATGSGKSTLGLLLLGLYKPTEGEILYDGTPLDAFNYRDLRGQFGVVLQEPFLFSDSIRRNISFNNPEASLADVRFAARRAAIDEEIERMPMGYETLVAEGGAGLSGGQRQRIAIARALAQAPAVLLLDEATSSLDVATERVVDQSLDALSCTRVVIAHRLSTIRGADAILVLHHGTIVERGTHDDLIVLDGYYRALVRGQLQPVAHEPERAAALYAGPGRTGAFQYDGVVPSVAAPSGESDAGYWMPVRPRPCPRDEITHTGDRVDAAMWPRSPHLRIVDGRGA